MAWGWKWWLLPLLAVALLAAYGSLSLQLSSARDVFLEFAPKLGLALLLLFFGRVLFDLAAQVVENVVQPPELRRTVRTLAAILVWSITALAIVIAFIGDLSMLLIAAGLACLGLALALQKPILSFVGWVAITSNHIYKVGDFVEVAGTEGDVVAVDLLVTSIRASGDGAGKLVLIPNSTVLEQPVTNYTHDFPYVWDELAVQIPRGATPQQVKKILLQACDEVIGNRKMAENARDYQKMMKSVGISTHRAAPEVLFSIQGETASAVLRYITPARLRAGTKSMLSERIIEALAGRKG